jgi:8-oxo-dGTP diphosphatase
LSQSNGSADAVSAPTIVVVAAVIIECGRVLVTQRPQGSHLAGRWEFPGGKVEPNEDPRDALARELREEIAIEVEVGDIFEVTFHRYAHKSVLLLFYSARRLGAAPEPVALEVADLAWRCGEQLHDAQFPEADRAALHKVRERLSGNPYDPGR